MDIRLQKTIPHGDDFDALDETLKAAYPTSYGGMSSAPSKGLIEVHIADNASAEDVSAIQAAILNFVPGTRTTEQQQRAATIAAVKTVAQNAVGVALTDLTAGQIKALLAVLLWRAGGVNDDGTVKALSDWVRG